jgi:hypothetical protein
MTKTSLLSGIGYSVSTGLVLSALGDFFVQMTTDPHARKAAELAAATKEGGDTSPEKARTNAPLRILAQELIPVEVPFGDGKVTTWDRGQTLRMSIVSGLIVAPSIHVYNMKIERVFPGKGTRAILCKTMFNMFLSSPLTLTTVFMANSFLAGESHETGFERAKDKAPKAWLVGGLYWPPVGLLIFKLVPDYLRGAAGSVAALFWQAYMSTLINASVEQAPPVLPEEAK